MRKSLTLKIILTAIITTALLTAASARPVRNNQTIKTSTFSDFDPLVDIEVTVDIQKIRSLEKFEYPIGSIKKIDLTSDPDFFVKVFINDQEFTSDVWQNTKFVYDPQFSPTFNVPDDVENVNIKIQLFDSNGFRNKACDIGGGSLKKDVDLTYSIKTGHWTGEDYKGDPSGYGRLNGCDDGSIYTPEKDCELWFNIYQTDFDGDGIPYSVEVEDYGTDPAVDNTGEDLDGDNVPIEWEWKWGYDPSVAEAHTNLDPDTDGLNNYEEYLVSAWGSDPARQDIFIELDQMEASLDGTVSVLSDGTKELLYTAFDTYNKVLHIDDGNMGGGEMIPFDESTSGDNLESIYLNYFLHGNENNWRRGVFRYGLVVYDPGMAGYNFFNGAFVIGSKYVDQKSIIPTPANKDLVYASVYMHETGHTLGIHNEGVDNQQTKTPWQISWWTWGPYKSCMNYRYTYRLVDYSDGSSSINDFNDWVDMDLTRFQHHWP